MFLGSFVVLIIKFLIMKKIILVSTIYLLIISCSSDSNSDSLNQYENSLLGTWEYRVSPHPSGVGVTNSFYRTFFTLYADRSGVSGFEEYISPTEQYNDSEEFTWNSTSSTIKRTLTDGTEDEGRYTLIDPTHLRLYSSDGTTSTVYTKQ